MTAAGCGSSTPASTQRRAHRRGPEGTRPRAAGASPRHRRPPARRPRQSFSPQSERTRTPRPGCRQKTPRRFPRGHARPPAQAGDRSGSARRSCASSVPRTAAELQRSDHRRGARGSDGELPQDIRHNKRPRAQPRHRPRLSLLLPRERRRFLFAPDATRFRPQPTRRRPRVPGRRHQYGPPTPPERTSGSKRRVFSHASVRWRHGPAIASALASRRPTALPGSRRPAQFAEDGSFACASHDVS